MNADEAVTLCRMAKQACPAMKLEDDTPTMWFMLLDDISYADALRGLVALAKQQPFVSPAEIRAEVKKARAKRITEFGVLPDPPAEVGADPLRYRRWLADCKRLIADGTVTQADQLPHALPPGTKRPIGQLIQGAFKQVDDVEPVAGEDEPPTVPGAVVG